MSRFFRRYPVVCLSACSSSVFPRLTMHIHTTHITHTNSPWSGPVDGVIWRAAPACVVFFSSKGREGSVCSFSILYRISLFPFPFAVVCVFTSFKKFVSDFCASRHHMPSSFSFLFLFSFPRLASPPDSFVAPRREIPPARSPVSISYRTVPYYITIRISSSPSNRLTNQPHSSNLGGAVQCTVCI